MKDIILSIIIPVYNAEKTISKTLDSILVQNTKNIEILIINDGSTDNSLEIIKKYGNKIKIINQENQGVSKARNNGIKNANGKYITFIDSDDIIKDLYFDDIRMQILENYNLIVYAYEEIYNDKVINRQFLDFDKHLNIEECFYNSINNGVYWMSVWNKIYKTDLVKDIEFNDIISNGEDFEFNIKYLSKINFEKVNIRNKAFYCYNISPGIFKYRKDSLITRVYITDMLLKFFNNEILKESANYYFWNSITYDLIAIIKNVSLTKKEKLKLFKTIKVYNNFRKYKTPKSISVKKKFLINIIKFFGYRVAYFIVFLYSLKK